MLLACLPPDGVVQQRCRWEFELRAQESHDRFRDDFGRLQQSSGITQRAQLQGESDTVLSSSPQTDVLQILFRQGVEFQKCRFIGRQIP